MYGRRFVRMFLSAKTLAFTGVLLALAELCNCHSGILADWNHICCCNLQIFLKLF